MAGRLSKNQRRITMVVTLTPSQIECSPGDVARYVEDAVSTMGGCKHPEDPFFDGLSVDEMTLGGCTFTFEE